MGSNNSIRITAIMLNGGWNDRKFKYIKFLITRDYKLKKDRYILFHNKAEAEDFIRELDQILMEHWDDPIVHPFNGKAIVSWNDEYLE